MQFFLPECVGKGSRFTFGVWGWRRVRSRLLVRSQPPATVPNYPQAFACTRMSHPIDQVRPFPAEKVIPTLDKKNYYIVYFFVT